MVRMYWNRWYIKSDNLNKVLNIDKENKLATFESGITLENLFKILNDNELALETMPNVKEISLGGALANSTHGTRTNCGTFGQMVHSLECIL